MISDKILVFIFIMLQIYVEYFLHQNMRRVVRFEFEHSNKLKYKEWAGNEYKYISDKRTKKGVNKGKVSLFLKCFLLDNSSEAITIKEEIELVFNEITKIRNLLVHGHKISLTGNSNSSDMKKSKTKEYLNEDVLIEIIKNINNLGKNWNKLLDLASSNCKALNTKRIGDFKFDSLDYKK